MDLDHVFVVVVVVVVRYYDCLCFDLKLDLQTFLNRFRHQCRHSDYAENTGDLAAAVPAVLQMYFRRTEEILTALKTMVMISMSRRPCRHHDQRFVGVRRRFLHRLLL